MVIVRAIEGQSGIKVGTKVLMRIMEVVCGIVRRPCAMSIMLMVRDMSLHCIIIITKGIEKIQGILKRMAM